MHYLGLYNQGNLELTYVYIGLWKCPRDVGLLMTFGSRRERKENKRRDKEETETESVVKQPL